jgi:hypothetical protein
MKNVMKDVGKNIKIVSYFVNPCNKADVLCRNDGTFFPVVQEASVLAEAGITTHVDHRNLLSVDHPLRFNRVCSASRLGFHGESSELKEEIGLYLTTSSDEEDPVPDLEDMSDLSSFYDGVGCFTRRSQSIWPIMIEVVDCEKLMG